MKKEIPLREFCKTNDSKIIEYLIENLYVPPYPRHDTTNIVGIAWNKMNWWYVYTNSSQPNVSESYIKNLMKESDNSELDEKEMEQMSEVRTKINKKSKTDSAFVSKLAILNSDKFEEQIKVDELKERLNKAKFNNGEEVTKREAYLNKLINLKNELTMAENNLTELTATIDFLTEVYEELK